MDTQKSIGKKLGIVIGFGKGWFTIKGKATLANGDGLCFINPRGVLAGVRVNRVDNDKVYPYGDMKDIKVGLEVYRNFDQDFSNALKNSSHNRWVDCSINVEQTDSGFIFTTSDEDGNSATVTADDGFDLAMNHEKALDNIKVQLSKSGDTIFKILKVDLSIDKPVFIPTSTINQIRRDLLELLLNKRLDKFRISKEKREKATNPYFEKKISYKGNVSNSLSKAFYTRQGVSSIDDAFELQLHIPNAELMVTRYCIKYEIGICPKKQNGKPTGELYLKDNNNLYPLEFDCKNCLMKVKSPKN